MSTHDNSHNSNYRNRYELNVNTAVTVQQCNFQLPIYYSNIYIVSVTIAKHR